MAFYMSLENKLDVDNDTDIISSHTGGGGGGDGAQATRQLRQPRIFASLFQLLWIDRYISLEQKGTSIAYTSPPPPPVIISERAGGGGCRRVKYRSRHGQERVVSWTREAYSPFKSLREMISCLMRYAVCNGIHTHKLH